MTIKQVTLRRVFNLGNYETLHIELQADIDKNEDVKEVLDDLHQEAKKYKRYTKS